MMTDRVVVANGQFSAVIDDHFALPRRRRPAASPGLSRAARGDPRWHARLRRAPALHAGAHARARALSHAHRARLRAASRRGVCDRARRLGDLRRAHARAGRARAARHRARACPVESAPVALREPGGRECARAPELEAPRCAARVRLSLRASRVRRLPARRVAPRAGALRAAGIGGVARLRCPRGPRLAAGGDRGLRVAYPCGSLRSGRRRDRQRLAAGPRPRGPRAGRSRRRGRPRGAALRRGAASLRGGRGARARGARRRRRSPRGGASAHGAAGVRDAVASVPDRRRPAGAAPPRAARLGGARRRLAGRGRLRQRVPVRGPAGRVPPGPRSRRARALRGHLLQGPVPVAASGLRRGAAVRCGGRSARPRASPTPARPRWSRRRSPSSFARGTWRATSAARGHATPLAAARCWRRSAIIWEAPRR